MTTAPTLFVAFTALIDELGLTPPTTDRDPFGTVASVQLDMALKAVQDFPVNRLKEISTYATRPGYEVRNVGKLIAEMKRLLAQTSMAEVDADYDRSDERIIRWAEHMLRNHDHEHGDPECSAFTGYGTPGNEAYQPPRMIDPALCPWWHRPDLEKLLTGETR